MPSIHRRTFLRQASASSTAVALGVWGRFAHAQSGPARVTVDAGRLVSKLDRRLLGSFIEHLGRAIYGGVYQPGSKLADENGFRKDVIEEVRRLGVPTIRYPGGNFVSGYDWRDGVGPKKDRPRVLERAWNSIETNQFGTNEFIAWCRAVATEPMLATNLGTGTPEMAAALVEYCNLEKGTRWSDLRRQHGIEKPHAVKYWCLGNEMDGPWQIGHMPATEYGEKAADAARQMRTVDRSVQLIVAGSSHPAMATYLDWDRQVLEACYNEVDGISLHRYFNPENEVELARALAMNLFMDRQIEEIAAVCDLVRGRRRSQKRLWLSFDEWNVWYRQTGGNGEKKEAPRLLEEVYDLQDAWVVGGAINSLLRHADRVKVACLAQLINVIAPLVTNDERVLRQTIYYPYAWALEYARGAVLDLAPESATYDAPRLGAVPFLDVVGTYDAEAKRAALFVLNRDTEKARDLDVTWHDLTPSRVLAFQTLTGADKKAANTFDAPDRVVPQPLEPPRAGQRMTLQFPSRSYTALHLAVD